VKHLKNMWRIILEKDEGEQITCTAHYIVTCEHGLSENKAMPITLTSEQKTQIKQFLAPIVIPQIKTAEKV